MKLPVIVGRYDLKTKFADYPRACLYVSRYIADESPALMWSTPGGEAIMTASVCLVEYFTTPLEGFVILKAYSENEGIVDTMCRLGLVSEPQFVGSPGFWQARMGADIVKALEVFDKQP